MEEYLIQPIDLRKREQNYNQEDLNKMKSFIDKRKSTVQNDMFTREVRKMRARLDRTKSLDQKQLEYIREKQKYGNWAKKNDFQHENDQSVQQYQQFLQEQAQNNGNANITIQQKQTINQSKSMHNLNQTQGQLNTTKKNEQVILSNKELFKKGASRNIESIKSKIFILSDKKNEMQDFIYEEFHSKNMTSKILLSHQSKKGYYQQKIQKQKEENNEKNSNQENLCKSKIKSVLEQIKQKEIELKNDLITDTQKKNFSSQKNISRNIVQIEQQEKSKKDSESKDPFTQDLEQKQLVIEKQNPLNDVKKIHNFLNFNITETSRKLFLEQIEMKKRSQSLQIIKYKKQIQENQEKNELYDDFYYNHINGFMSKAVNEEEKDRFYKFLQNPVLNSYVITRRSDLVDVKAVQQEIESLKQQQQASNKIREKFLDHVIKEKNQDIQIQISNQLNENTESTKRNWQIVQSKSKIKLFKESNFLLGTSQSKHSLNLQNQQSFIYLETEGDQEEDLTTVDGQAYLKKHKYLSTNNKKNNFHQQQEKRIKLNIPGQIIENLQLFDENGIEIGKRNPFKKYNSIRLKVIRQQIKAYSEKIKRIGLPFHQILQDRIFSNIPFEKPGSFLFLKYVKMGAIQQVQLMLKKDPFFIYQFDELKLTPIHWAVRNNDLEMTQFLIKHNSDVDDLDEVGRTPLYFAFQNQNIQLVKILFRNRAKPWVHNAKTLRNLNMNYKLRNMYKVAVMIQFIQFLGERLSDKAYKIFEKDDMPDLYK